MDNWGQGIVRGCTEKSCEICLQHILEIRQSHPLLLQLNWIPLRERRARAKVTLLYKTINNIVEIHTNYLTNPSDDSATDATAEEIHTRQFDQICIPYARTNQ